MIRTRAISRIRNPRKRFVSWRFVKMSNCFHTTSKQVANYLLNAQISRCIVLIWKLFLKFQNPNFFEQNWHKCIQTYWLHLIYTQDWTFLKKTLWLQTVIFISKIFLAHENNITKSHLINPCQSCGSQTFKVRRHMSLVIGTIPEVL